MCQWSLWSVTRVIALIAVGATAVCDGRAADLRPREPVTVAAKRLGDVVAAQDIGKIVGFIDVGGVSCVDEMVPRIEVERDLRADGTWLRDYFLDPAGFRKRRAGGFIGVSLAEVVGSRGWTVVVLPGEPEDHPCVTFTRGNPALRAQVCFLWSGKQWVLRELPNCG